jgi:hypothetical protein
MADVIDLATDGGKLLAVLCYEPQNSIFHYGLGTRTGARVFPGERKSTPAPKLLAVDSEGRTFLVSRRGDVSVWDAAHNNLGQWTATFPAGEDMEACAGRVFVLDAKARAVVVLDAGGVEAGRIKLPRRCAPGDLAVSDYGVVYVFDSGARAVLKYRAGR